MRISTAVLSMGLVVALASAASAQDPEASAAYADITLNAGFMPDPHTVSLTAGGSIDVNVSGCSYGYVANAPDVKLTYNTSGSTTLYVYVMSNEDTTLLINMPDRSWACNDDGFGNRNPILTFGGARSGRYDIWVGTYGSTNTPATLYITEINPRGGK